MQGPGKNDFTFVVTSQEVRDGVSKCVATSHAAKWGWKRRKESLTTKEESLRHRQNKKPRIIQAQDVSNTSHHEQEPQEKLVTRLKQQHTTETAIQRIEQYHPREPSSAVKSNESTSESDVVELNRYDESGALINPFTLLDSSLIDPFATFSQPVDRTTSFLLTHFANSVLPSLFPSKALASRAKNRYMKWAMENAASQYALAYRTTWEIPGWNDMSGDMKAIPGVKEFLDPRHFRDLTIKALNNTLQSTSNPDISPLSLIVSYLVIGEVLRGDQNGVRAHMAGLRALVKQAGGLSNLSSVIAIPLVLTSLLASALIQEAPALHRPRLDTLAITPATAEILESCPDPEIGRVGRAFISSENYEVLGSTFLELVLARRRMVLFEELHRLEILSPSPADLDWYENRRGSVEYDLMTKPASTLTPEQDAIRLAMVSFTFSSILANQRATYAFSQVLTGQLKLCLDKTDIKNLWRPRTKLLMWIVLMGAHGSKNKPERPWYVLQLARCFGKLGIERIEDAKEVFVEYFYLERIHGRSLKELWDEADLLRLLL